MARAGDAVVQVCWSLERGPSLVLLIHVPCVRENFVREFVNLEFMAPLQTKISSRHVLVMVAFISCG